MATNPSLRPVILTASHTPNDILPAFLAGACGFLGQDIPSKHLIKSLELIALGQSVMHPHFQQMVLASLAGRESSEVAAQGELSVDPTPTIQLFPPRLADLRRFAGNSHALASEQPTPGNEVVRSLSRRELVILRTLTEGASNKIIARKLVITESTVKVHMKAILRKLRLQNRTQAAIWARTHLGAAARKRRLRRGGHSRLLRAFRNTTAAYFAALFFRFSLAVHDRDGSPPLAASEETGEPECGGFISRPRDGGIVTFKATRKNPVVTRQCYLKLS